MDDSIEIIGEVPGDPDYQPPPEIEIIAESQLGANLRKSNRKEKVLDKEVKKPEMKKNSVNKQEKKSSIVSASKSRAKLSEKRKLPDSCEVPKSKKAKISGSGKVGLKKNIKEVDGDDDIQIIFEWDPAAVISERQGLEEWQVRSVINMFDKENTLPFIARYRKEKTGNLEVEKLREIQNGYSQLKSVKEKVVKVMKSDNIAKLEMQHRNSLLRATTMQEVEHLTAPLKSGAKRTLAERAKQLGLEQYALQILDPHHGMLFKRETLWPLVDVSKKDLSSVEEIEQGIRYIIADIISKDPKVLEFVRSLIRQCNPRLECSKKKVSAKTEKKNVPNASAVAKLENYSNYKNYAFASKPHQILAINRGEKQNILSVKVVIPHGGYIRFCEFCRGHLKLGPPCYRTDALSCAIEDSWERLVKPSMERHTRSLLTENAEFASVEVFASNLKNLLLSPPLRGKTILAIDPGFSHGCKIGVVSPKGEHLLVKTIYPFQKNWEDKTEWSQDPSARTLHEIVNQYGCEYFAIGNGTACRQVEAYLSNLISNGCFTPHNVQYTIINESGVSQYSITPEARTEFPGMEPNHISAVSLARRLQDPLLEYVKVHPMNLGVGMYQHDLPEKLLHSSLESVMTECVSFVGVDINVASQFVLRKVSGLNASKAAKIVDHRKSKGPFTNRQQLLDVKGIGPVAFEQCAGFVKIVPQTLEAQIEKTPKKKKKSAESCPLDQTMIHPESYEAALKFIKLVGVDVSDVGTEPFIKKIVNHSRNSTLAEMSQHCDTNCATMQLIVEGLSLSADFDMRAQFEEPLFRKAIRSIADLKAGAKVSGTVRNVTHFGAFVDIGVGVNGLIHTSHMKGHLLELGANVEATVMSIDKKRERIPLSLEQVLS